MEGWTGWELNQVTSLCGRLNNLQTFYSCQWLEVGRWGSSPYNLLIFVSLFSIVCFLNKPRAPPSPAVQGCEGEDSPPKSIVRTTKRLMLNIPMTTPRLAKRKLWLCGQQATWWLPRTSSSAVASDLDLLDLAGDLPGVPPGLRPPPDLLLWLLRDLRLLWRPPLPAALRLL